MTEALDSLAGHEETNIPYSETGKMKLPRVAIARQKPLMIGFIDQRMTIAEEDVRIFQLSEENESISNMVNQFLQFIFESHEKAIREKTNLLQPIFNWIIRYKTAHFKFFTQVSPWTDDSKDDEEEEGDRTRLEKQMRSKLIDSGTQYSNDNTLILDIIQDIKPLNRFSRCELYRVKSILESWEHSIFGKFETTLQKLTRSYFIFGFNAEKYDNIILNNYICLSARNHSNARVGIIKDGNKIKSISIGPIKFCEARRLITQDCSLDGFGKMCELEVKKMSFPFGILTSHKVLERDRLPSNRESWRNDLRNELPSSESIDEAIRNFQAGGHTNLRSYISQYLKHDVIILQQSLVKLNGSYTDLLDINFIEARKLTVSGLSYMAAHLYLCRNRKIGFFSINNATVYSVMMRNIIF
jgi:hypothetical protein